MESKTLPKEFIFNEKMDKDTLYGLYAGDLPYVEEIFATTLQHFDTDFGSVQEAFENAQLDDLKRAVHKIKPTFGFVGLLQTQAACKDFEDNCARATEVPAIAPDYSHIKNLLLEAKDIIQHEYTRLKAFNAQSL